MNRKDINKYDLASTTSVYLKNHNELIEEYREIFSRDRDRILYSKEFRRLSGKTQVFVAGFDDHTRTRLTHTIEVNQIAVTIARALNLNVELTEAIAYGHDVGHTPFGHVGERFLNLLNNGCFEFANVNYNNVKNQRGFKHNLQGVRVVTKLEKICDKYEGMNLTSKTIWGILNHSSYKISKQCEYMKENKNLSLKNKKRYICTLKTTKNIYCHNKGELRFDFYNDIFDGKFEWSFEGMVVAIADEIAQRHHDVEDAIEAKIITVKALLRKINKTFRVSKYKNYTNLIKKIKKLLKKNANKEQILHALSKLIISMYVNNLVDNSKNNIKNLIEKIEANNPSIKITQKILFQEVYLNKNQEQDQNKNKLKEIINFDVNFQNEDKIFHNYLKQVVLNSHIAQKMDGKSQFLLRQIVKAYVTNPQQLPDKTIIALFKNFQDIYINKVSSERKKQLDNNLEFKELKKYFSSKENDYFEDIREALKKLIFLRLEEFNIALIRTITDYISGMTDDYAIKVYESLYGFNKEHNFY